MSHNAGDLTAGVMDAVKNTADYNRLASSLLRVVAAGGDAVELVLQAQGVDNLGSAGLKGANTHGELRGLLF